MSKHYTDKELLLGTMASCGWEENHRDSRTRIAAVLDAVAPAIAARALRDAADSAQHYGTAATNASAVRVWLRNRADDIEAGR